MPESETFPFPPLQEVAFEVNFSTKLRIQKNIDDFQDAITDEFPEYSEEVAVHMVPGQAAELEPTRKRYVFASPTGKRAVRVTTNSLNIIVQDYTNFSELRDLANRMCEKFAELYNIARFSRVGLRYVNRIEVDQVNGVCDFPRLVRPALDMDRFKLDDISMYVCTVRLKRDGLGLAVRSGLAGLEDAPDGSGKKGVYVLDFDGYVEGESEAADLEGNLDALHSIVEAEFLSSATEDLLARMRGENHD